MAKRMILMLVLMTVLIAGLGFVKVRQFQAMADEYAAMQPPPNARYSRTTDCNSSMRSSASTSWPWNRFRSASSTCR